MRFRIGKRKLLLVLNDQYNIKQLRNRHSYRKKNKLNLRWWHSKLGYCRKSSWKSGRWGKARNILAVAKRPIKAATSLPVGVESAPRKDGRKDEIFFDAADKKEGAGCFRHQSGKMQLLQFYILIACPISKLSKTWNLKSDLNCYSEIALSGLGLFWILKVAHY